MENHLPTSQRACWCGNPDLLPFAPDYMRCAVCETLVVKTVIADTISEVENDDTDLYGKTYFTSHQSDDYGLPDLPTRARKDLPERCAHWLRRILKYRLPPATSIELGSAHGGFVAMLRRAGFAAQGLDLSPWLVEFSSKTFEVPILCGMVEKQAIAPGSLDVICLFDVLEHLPNPRSTMAHCLGLLKPTGFLAVQTPCYPAGKTLEEVLAAEPAFAAQFKPKEHIHIFSKNSVQRLFAELGAPEVVFEEAIFGHYDMFPFVSRVPLSPNPPEAISEALLQTADSRFILAILDAEERVNALQKACDERLEVIRVLDTWKEQTLAAAAQKSLAPAPAPPTSVPQGALPKPPKPPKPKPAPPRPLSFWRQPRKVVAGLFRRGI